MTSTRFSPVIRLGIFKPMVNDNCICGMRWFGQTHTVIVKIPSVEFIKQHFNEYGLIDSKTTIKLNSNLEDSLHFSKEELCRAGVCTYNVWPNEIENCTCIKGWNIISGEILFNTVKDKCLEILEMEQRVQTELELKEYNRQKYLQKEKRINTLSFGQPYIKPLSHTERTTASSTNGRVSYWEQGNRHIKSGVQGTRNSKTNSNSKSKSKSKSIGVHNMNPNSTGIYVADKYQPSKNN
jgi:hypothetical protein